MSDDTKGFTCTDCGHHFPGPPAWCSALLAWCDGCEDQRRQTVLEAEALADMAEDRAGR